MIVDRFFVHKTIQAFASAILHKHGRSKEEALLFPTHVVAARCVSFIYEQDPRLRLWCPVRILDLYPSSDGDNPISKTQDRGRRALISAVLFPESHVKTAKTFWQHAGDGISSRRAEYCLKAFEEGQLSVLESSSGTTNEPSICKGPRRYRKTSSVDVKDGVDEETLSSLAPTDGRDFLHYVEERFGRNLDIKLATKAKDAIRRRIAGALCAGVDFDPTTDGPKVSKTAEQGRRISESDVYLYPCGMSAIFNTHRTMVSVRGQLKSVSFGFPYIDTLKILEKWGPGCIFYGHGSAQDLDDLEARCEGGEKFLALFCEFPGNPLLKAPDLERIRKLADRYDFAVVVDETIGNFINVDVLPRADVVVSSLTKIFTGEGNVMGGSAVLNPQSQYYQRLKSFMASDFEDNYWPEDAIFMERNSRDFVSRIHRINANAEVMCDTLRESPAVKEIFYPKYSPTRQFYDQHRNPDGGYGGLLSVTFHTTAQAVEFFDKLATAKGPSLGTNFTLSSPYVILAHYGELEWVKQFGVDPDLIRISVGLEDADELRSKVQNALKAVEALREA